MQLLGREQERASIDGVIEAARSGFSAVLVLRGEAGIGKTALLDYAVEESPDLHVARISGIEWEVELGYSGLHQLALPFLGSMGVLPAPQRMALRSAFGMEAGSEPNRFMVALATLTLLAEMASDQPLLCVIDDAHWIDEDSAGALAFVARRLHADRVAMLFGVREGADRLPVFEGLPTLELGGLPDKPARELLGSVVHGRVGRRVADRIVTETGGNPLGLIALGAELTQERLAGGSPFDILPISQRVESRFLRDVRELSHPAQALLLAAAADPTGDSARLWRAGAFLGFGKDEATGVGIGELLDLGPPIVFRHPLIRSAVYYGSSTADRRKTHEVLAGLTDSDKDPDRWAWHLGAAAAEPDEHTAAVLQQAAERGRSRGGFSGSAALLTRAAELTPDEHRRAERFLAAASASVMAGVPQRSQSLLELAVAGLDSPLQLAEALRVRGATLRLLFDPSAVPALMDAARALEPYDLREARDTWLAALEAEVLAQHDLTGSSLRHVAEEALKVPEDPQGADSIGDFLLNGIASRIAISHVAAVPMLREAIVMMCTDDPYNEAKLLSPWWLGDIACRELWDDSSRREILHRLTAACRERGALFTLSIALLAQFERETWIGHFDLAEALFVEGREITTDIGMEVVLWDLFKVTLLAWRGLDAETRLSVEESEALSKQAGIGALLHHAYMGLVILDLGLGRYQEAFEHAQRIYEDDPPGYGTQILPELVEAGVRSGRMDIATAALDRFSERVNAAGTPLALGLLSRAMALVADGSSAETLYEESIEQLAGTDSRPEVARSHLLYGEWLRRRKRRIEAREQLALALEAFELLGATAFAERSRRELVATGATARKRTVATISDLTPQEERIARFAASGATNPEIASQMFLSSSTVEYHLRKVFRKLGLTSRRQLSASLNLVE